MMIKDVLKINTKKSKVITYEGFAFALYQREISFYGIEPEKELAEEVLYQSIFPLLTKRAKERVLYILKDRDKTEHELKNKLAENFFPEEIIQEVITWAISNRYIDDCRYASFFVEVNKEKRSRADIMKRLLQRGIDKNIISEALDGVEFDEEKQIIKELKKKGYKPESADIKKKQSLYRLLSGKGYSYEIIREVMENEEAFS